MIFGLYKQLRETGECIAASLCCFVCLGPILAIVGIALIVSAGTDDRSPKVDAYNAAVSTWKASGYYAALGAQYTARVANAGAGTLATTANTNQADPLLVDSGTGVSTYTQRTRAVWSQISTDGYPFAYAAPPPTVAASPVTENLRVTDSRTGASEDITVPMSWTSVSYPCSTSDTAPECTQKCNARGGSRGTYSGSATQCYRYFLLTEVCLVARNATTPGSVLDNAGKSGYGCVSVSSDVTGFSDGTFGSYSRVSVGRLGPFGYTGSASIPGAWPTIPITVRSSADPYVTAMRLTNGSPSSFGLTIKEKLTTGFALLGIGGGLFAIPACLIYLVVRGICGRRRGPQAYAVNDYGMKPGMGPGMMPGAAGIPIISPAGPITPIMPMGPGGGYPTPAPGYPPATGGYPAPGYPPQQYPAGPNPYAPQAGYPPQPYPPQQYPPQQYPPQGGYPMAAPGGYQPQASAPGMYH